MENENEGMKQENTADTAKAETTATETEQKAEATSQEEEKLTQSQVNDIVTKRLAKQAEGFYKKYGVMDEKGMDELVEKAKNYDELDGKFKELSDNNAMLNRKFLFTTNNIAKDREDDVDTYFRGKNIELTDENLKASLKTHQEWVGKTAPQTIGTNGENSGEDPDDAIARMFGLKHFLPSQYKK